MGHFSSFCLLQQLFENKGFCMETRLCNNFETANAITLAKIILERFNTVLQDEK